MRDEVSATATVDASVDTHDVRAFCRVVDLGSITAAARSLGETKGSVSRRVSRLERVLGIALVRRTGHRAQPTDDGLVYRAKAGRALDLLDDAAATLRDLRGVPTGHLRVTAPVGIGSLVIGPLVAPFTEVYPQVTLELVLTDAVLSFGDHQIDVAIRATASLPDSTLVAHRLLDLQPVLVAAPAYAARAGLPATPSELPSHRLLVIPRRGSTFPVTLARDDERVDLALRGHVLSHDMLLLREAAIGGAGITTVLGPMAERDIAAGRLVRVLPEWDIVGAASLYMLRASGPVPPKIRAFWDFAREHIRTRC